MFSSKFVIAALAMASSASAAALSAAVAQSAAIAQSAAVAQSAATAATAATAASVATVTAAAVDSRIIHPEASPSITLCSGSINPPQGCISIPVVSDTCTSFTGGLSFLEEALTGAQIPAGFICTFFSAFGCQSSAASDRVVLTGGTWSFFNVPGNTGNENFNDMASSFSCSPV